MTENTPAEMPVAIEMAPGSVPRVYATKGAIVIAPGTRAVFILVAPIQLVALRGFVWTTPGGPVGPTFDIPIEDAHQGKIQVEILLGALLEGNVFQALELPDRRLQTIRDHEGNTWMFSTRVVQETLAHTPTHLYEPLDCAIQVSFVNASEAPLELPVAGLFVYCVPRAGDEPGLQGGL